MNDFEHAEYCDCEKMRFNVNHAISRKRETRGTARNFSIRKL